MTRRTAIRYIAAPAILHGRYSLFAQSPAEYSARAIGILQETPVVDLLNQFRFPDYSEKPPRIEHWRHRPETFTGEDADVYQNSGINVFALGSAASDWRKPDKHQALEKIEDLTLLSDIFPTGYDGAVKAGVTTGSTVYVAAPI